MNPERFTMPTTEQLVRLAYIFNGCDKNKEKIADLVVFTEFILQRLHAGGDIHHISVEEIIEADGVIDLADFGI